jgi:KUP system potassium uptake protein
LALGALGVVFGGIGTSPLYTIQTTSNPGDPHPVAATRASIFGIVSLIFWSVTLIVTVTYVLPVMRAYVSGERDRVKTKNRDYWRWKIEREGV